VFGCKAFAMTSEAQLKKNRLQRFNPKAWIGYLVGYNSTNIYRIWNPVTNRVILTRDVIFNENQVFSGDIQQLKDDLLHISADELEAMLCSIEIPQESELSCSTQIEDDELYVAVREVNASGDTEQEGGGIECEPDQLHLSELYAPLLTPEATPPAALLATAIRCSGNQEEEAEDQLLNTQDKPFSGKSCSMSTKYGN